MLEAELQQLKQRQQELRQRLRQLKSGSTEVRKLEEKLAKQLAEAKWTVQQIQELRPDWDEAGFYQSVQPQQPKPRGRRPKSALAPEGA